MTPWVGWHRHSGDDWPTAPLPQPLLSSRPTPRSSGIGGAPATCWRGMRGTSPPVENPKNCRAAPPCHRQYRRTSGGFRRLPTWPTFDAGFCCATAAGWRPRSGVGPASDRRLLKRFAETRDEAAFATPAPPPRAASRPSGPGQGEGREKAAEPYEDLLPHHAGAAGPWPEPGCHRRTPERRWPDNPLRPPLEPGAGAPRARRARGLIQQAATSPERARSQELERPRGHFLLLWGLPSHSRNQGLFGRV